MDLSQIPLLTTAIAVCIAWALFALFCSYLHEAVVQFLAERGRFLKANLFKQLQDRPNGINWALLVYQHGAVDMLTRNEKKPTNDISPELFAKTLVETVGNAHLVQMKAVAVVDTPAYKSSLLNNFSLATKVLQPSDVVGMFKQCLADAETKAMTNGSIDESKLYDALLANIQTWYNQLMQRITLWYKKATRWRLFILGAIIAAVINVDSIELFQLFSVNQAASNAVISYYAKNKTDLENKIAATKGDTTQTQTESIAKIQLQGVTKSLDSLSEKANLPIGFSHNLVKTLRDDWCSCSWGAALTKILGILISGFAASFGAPFWFDLLKKAYTPQTKS